MGRLSTGDIIVRATNIIRETITILKEAEKNITSYLYRDTSKQLYRSVTSIGANLHEADMAVSDKDFKNKLSIALKETAETIYRMTLVNEHFATLFVKQPNRLQELAKILQTIIGKINIRLKNL